MGIRQFADGLINALSGMGGSRDPRSYNAYAFLKLTDQQIDAAFRASWAIRKIISKPAADMTREWRDWQTDKANIEKLEAEETRLDVRSKFERAEVLRGLGGAGMVIYIKGDDQTKPLDPAKIAAGGITALHVWHKSCFNLGEPLTGWEDPWFGHPSFYAIRLQGAGQEEKFHPSRIIAFRGEPIGGMSFASWQDAWWGDSTVDVIKEAVDNVHTGENGFAGLIKDSRNRRLSIPKLYDRVGTAAGEALLAKRMDALAVGESQYGVTLLDAGGNDGEAAESIEDRQMVWTGIPDIKASNLMVAAAAGRMPVTVLLGKSADGMNATGKGDQDAWDQEVKSRQDLRMRPCLAQLDVPLIPSALGKVDPQVWWEFAPLSAPTEAEEATTFNTSMDAVTKLQNSGLVPDIAMSKAVQNFMVERGYLPGLDDALAEVPEAERFPSEIAEPEPEGGDQSNVVPMRRAANDMLTALRDAIERGDTDEQMLELLGAEGGQQGERPFNDTYRPSQPRDRNGRWAKSGSTREFIAHAAKSPEPRRARAIGLISSSASNLLGRLGHDTKGKSVVLDHSYTRHILAGHGTSTERLRGQKPVTQRDLAQAHHIINGSMAFMAGTPDVGRQGHPRFEASMRRGRTTYTIVGETRKNTVVVISMWKK